MKISVECLVDSEHAAVVNVGLTTAELAELMGLAGLATTKHGGTSVGIGLYLMNLLAQQSPRMLEMLTLGRVEIMPEEF